MLTRAFLLKLYQNCYPQNVALKDKKGYPLPAKVHKIMDFCYVTSHQMLTYTIHTHTHTRARARARTHARTHARTQLCMDCS